MVCLVYVGDEQLYGHLHLEAVIEQNYLEGVCSGWDKKSDMVQTSISLMTWGSYFTHASVAE